MISRLRGILLDKQPDALLIEIDVRGVAYEVFASMQTFYQLPAISKEIMLYTHVVFREDAQQLFGFYHEQERRLFRALLKASGIGPKLALGILSSISPEAFVLCIMNQDRDSLIRIPGLGKKTVERLLLEMRDRLKDWQTTLVSSAFASTIPGKVSPQQDALSALIALGYKPAEATRALQNIGDHINSTEEFIRLALKRMVEAQTA